LKYNKSDMLKPQTAFHSLTPDRVINLVEKGLGNLLTNLCRPLISYFNRVYELQAEDTTTFPLAWGISCSRG